VKRWIIVLAMAALQACSPGQVADRILVGGAIITVDGNDSIAEALAIKDGRILAVGTDEEIEAYAGRSTERIELDGLTATPGLLDAHAHFAGGGLDLMYVLDLSYPKIEGIDDVIRFVGDLAEELGDGEWVQGRGWDEGKLEEQRYIYASDLDPVSPDNPVWLTHTMGHYGVANSVGLELAGITSATPDPPGGTIDRRADGTPTGILKESAQALVGELIPAMTPDQLRRAIENLVKEFHREGMTGFKEPGIGPEEWEAYRRVLADGDLQARAFILWQAGTTWTTQTTLADAEALVERIGGFTRPYEARDSDVLISGGVKMYLDGSGGARTAWMHEDWNKNRDEIDEGNRGYPLFDPEIVREQIRIYHDAGLHISVHAIGDRAIDWVVDSYALALEKTPTKGLRHGIIHANIPTDHALDRIAFLQKEYDAAYPEPSATFMWWIGDTYAGNFGPERSLRLNPFKTFLNRGIRWADSSDFNVTPFPARYALWASVKRQTVLGIHGDHPWGLEEAVDIQTALRSRTIWAARQMFLEDAIGSLEVGKYADIAVWDKNLYTMPADDIKDIECQMTYFNGEPVFIRGSNR
jgi:predicted amidohydrolase YtcJ